MGNLGCWGPHLGWENGLKSSNQQTGEGDFLESGGGGTGKVNDLHHLLFNKGEETRRNPLSMGTQKDGTQSVPSEQAQARGGGRNQGKKVNLEENGIQTRFRIYLFKGSEVKKAKRLKG